MFRLTQDLDINGTFLLARTTLSPARVMRAFGNPQPGDGYKTTGEFYFTGPEGSRFTLYDWKYGHNMWSVHDTQPIELNIGGDDHSRPYVHDFQAWLEKQTA
jgi:hypothetical protein